MPYLLTAPDARETKQQTYRYFVELASNELGYEGVPERFRIVDVVVMEPTQEAIESLIAAAGWLDGWRIVSNWVPVEEDCPF